MLLNLTAAWSRGDLVWLAGESPGGRVSVQELGRRLPETSRIPYLEHEDVGAGSLFPMTEVGFGVTSDFSAGAVHACSCS